MEDEVAVTSEVEYLHEDLWIVCRGEPEIAVLVELPYRSSYASIAIVLTPPCEGGSDTTLGKEEGWQ